MLLEDLWRKSSRLFQVDVLCSFQVINWWKNYVTVGQKQVNGLDYIQKSPFLLVRCPYLLPQNNLRSGLLLIYWPFLLLILFSTKRKHKSCEEFTPTLISELYLVVFFFAYIKNLHYVGNWYAEPRGGSQDDFELVLKGYYDSIHHGKRPALGRKRRIKKIDLNHFYTVDSPQDSKKGGAALLGVCRGKVHHNLPHLIFYYFDASFFKKKICNPNLTFATPQLCYQ